MNPRIEHWLTERSPGGFYKVRLMFPADVFSFSRRMVEVNNVELQLKDQFYITLINNRMGEKIHEALQGNTEKMQVILQYIEEFSPSFKLLNKYHLVQATDDESIHTIVQLVDMPDVMALYERIEAIMNAKFDDYPPLHVTLFTTHGHGIWLYSKRDMEYKTQEILTQSDFL